MLSRIDQWLCAQRVATRRLLTLLLLMLVGTLDHHLGAEVSTALFYLLPVLFAGWYLRPPTGLLTAVTAAALWGLNDYSSSPLYSSALIALWNSLVRLVIFTLIAQLLAKLQRTLLAEQQAADCDSLTGLLNRRGFNQRLLAEHARAQRYAQPFTLAYLDVDHFKQVNDSRGHKAGDQLLLSIAQALQGSTRSSDCIGRLGGDEFALLLPQISVAAARSALDLAQQRLNARMAQEQWPVTFSIGAVTFTQAPANCHDAVTLADQLMYRVKQGGKNAIAYAVWDGPSPASDTDPAQP